MVYYARFFVLLLSGVILALASEDISHASTSIVDLLSSSIDYYPLLRAIQRARLVPILNKSRNITFIAPNEKAFRHGAAEPSREQLLYHIIESPVRMSSSYGVYYTRLDAIFDVNETQIALGSPIALRNGQIGNVTVTKQDWNASNGIVQGVDMILPIPPYATEKLADMPHLSIMADFLLSNALKSERNLTLICPEDSAFTVFNEIEMSFLRSKYGQLDRELLLGRHIVRGRYYSTDITQTLRIPSLEGEMMTLSPAVHATTFTVDGARVVTKDIITRNLPLHVTKKLQTPKSLKFTPAKYLFGINCTVFGEKASRAGRFNNSAVRQIIFAPVNDAFKHSAQAEKAIFDYHTIKDSCVSLEDGTLLTSELHLDSLDGDRQVIKISVKDDKLYANGHVRVLPFRGEKFVTERPLIS